MNLKQTQQTHKNSLIALSIAAIGIVYGDIGTSPLYTIKSVFSPENGLTLNTDNLLGVVSLIFWGMTCIISIKYINIIMRADNRGEGGIIALMSLATSSLSRTSRWATPLMFIGIFGATLFCGSGVITPAISVLSAIEGLNVAAPSMKAYVVPISVIVIIALYSVQSRGTAGIAKWFGPLMLIWFTALAVMGLINIVQTPAILKALNPFYAAKFLFENGIISFMALGTIVLAFTGAESLYADMGHFGARPIRFAWAYFVFPALTLNYFGQGALLISNPAAISNPFFQQLGTWSTYPLVALSTAAAVVASQATISGTFSVIKQAIALGFLPRMKINHTSDKEIGQIYIPLINGLQLLAVLIAVLIFKSSENLAVAYGISATATMILTTTLAFFVIRNHWKYSLPVSAGICVLLLCIEIPLFLSTTINFKNGGWFPLVLGICIYAVMLTWRRGRQLVDLSLKNHAIPLKGFLDSLFQAPPPRVPGTAIFMRGPNDGVPYAMLHNIKHNHVLHERVIFLTIIMHETPWIPQDERIKIDKLGNECYQIWVHYGFMDEANIPEVLKQCKPLGFEFDVLSTSFFISRLNIISTPDKGMHPWREMLFVAMTRNARGAADYYKIPTTQAIELGAQVEI